MNEKELLIFIDTTTGDPHYQTVEIQGKRIREGYSKSFLSWENILKTGISFTNKSVCEIGCYLGYFCFKVELAGACKVLGLDTNKPAIEGAKKIKELSVSSCEFIRKTAAEEQFLFQHFDIIMVLNVLHHIKRRSNTAFLNTLNQIFNYSSEVIFEVNTVEISELEIEAQKYNFKCISKVASHRAGRQILYFVKGSK